MAVTADATVTALETLQLNTREAQFLVSTAHDDGKADGIPVYPPLSGLIITVHHAGNDRYTIEIH